MPLSLSCIFFFLFVLELTIACTIAECEAPYPPSPVIMSLTWAPSYTIVRQASGSDNWPITWGDDDKLYTAFGDGWGFKSKVPSKLSLGLDKIIGLTVANSQQPYLPPDPG